MAPAFYESRYGRLSLIYTSLFQYSVKFNEREWTRLNFLYSIMEYTFLEEVTEGYCLHFWMKLQKDTV